MSPRCLKATLICLLASALVLSGCSPTSLNEQPVSSDEHTPSDMALASLGDPALLRHVKDSVESSLANAIDQPDQVVENIEAMYYSKEYLEEVAYNSQANIYFGYTLAELENQFEGNKYVFSPDGSGKTIAKAFEDYDGTYDQIIRNVAVGGGVILLLVTVSVVTPATGATAAVSVIVAASAKSAAILAASDALLSAVVAAVTTGIRTGDLEQALKEAGLAGSEGFMWGAIAGALAGGVAEFSRLRGAASGGVSLNKAAEAQRTWKYSTIKRMGSAEELSIYERAGLRGRCTFRGKGDALRKIDLDHAGPDGRTNLARMKDGLAALDPTNNLPYELHHIGQQSDSPLAILTRAEHTGGGNDKILHPNQSASQVDHGYQWQKQTKAFWQDYAAQAVAGMLGNCLG